MATPVFACGFECGIITLIPGHWNTGFGTPTFETSPVRSGLRSLRCNPSASTEYAYFTPSTGQLRWVGRIYIYFATSLPSADTALVFLANNAGASPQVRFKNSDSKIYAAVGTTFGASGVTVTTGVWYRIDFDFNVATGGNDAADVQVDGSACGQATATGLSSTPTNVGVGVGTTCTADVNFDDFLLSFTAADYPLGAGYVKSYIPNADGTHNVAGANDFERSLTGTDIDNATTDAYTLIAERPLPTTEVDFINGKAPPNATDYVEWQYEDSEELIPPRAVEHIFVHHDAGGAGTNNFTITLREHAGGTSADTWTGTTNVGATITYKRAHYATVPGTSDAWTETKFNALRSRFLVSDASPDVYIDAAMLEVEFPEMFPKGVGLGLPYGQSGQKQMRQLLAT